MKNLTHEQLKKSIIQNRYQDIKLIDGTVVKNFDTSKIKLIRTGCSYSYNNGVSQKTNFYETITTDGNRYEISPQEKTKLSGILELFNVCNFECDELTK